MNKISLYYREGTSDKEYHAEIVPAGNNLFKVNFAYGRRGSALASSTKTQVPVSLASAQRIFDKLVAEKQAKGYSPGEEGTPYVATDKEGRQTGVHPQLLNTIDEGELAALVADDAWCAQPKHDGKRLLLRHTIDHRGGRNIEHAFTAINRLGLEVGFPKPVEQHFADGVDEFLIDGEIVGDTFHVFDLLEYHRQDLRKDPYQTRLLFLSSVVGPDHDNSGVGDDHVQLVETAKAADEKKALVARLRQENAEGVVFKRLDAKYVPGRPAHGGTQRKFKFWESATCVVMAINARRSVQLGVLDSRVETTRGTAMTPIGNVTIPPNQIIPSSGDIVEVRYLYAYPNGSLFQPTYLGKRDDVPRGECVVEQLKFKPE